MRRLVAGYDRGLDLPLSAAERAALPVAVARLDTAVRRHLASIGPELAAARRIMAGLDRWSDAFA